MKVSVLMLTFNHEKYIEQAIESVLMQVVNFDYEIVIGDDFSTDKTRAILINYNNKYKNRIRLLLKEYKLGIMENYIQTFKACRGKYIAILEGDDYWTSKYKLQSQVDLLDSNNDFTVCFHPVIKFHQHTGETSILNPAQINEVSTIDNLVLENYIPTCSVMYRNFIIKDFPEWFKKLSFGDWTTSILHAQKGKIGKINKIMGVYRIHQGGVWSMQNEINKIMATVEAYTCINTYLNYEYDNTIRKGISSCYYRLSRIYLRSGDIETALRYIKLSFSIFPFNPYISRKQQFKLLFKIQMLWIYRHLN